MSILITLIVYLVVFGLIWWLISMLPLPQPVGLIVNVLFILLVLFALLSVVGLVPGGAFPRISL